MSFIGNKLLYRILVQAEFTCIHYSPRVMVSTSIAIIRLIPHCRWILITFSPPSSSFIFNLTAILKRWCKMRFAAGHGAQETNTEPEVEVSRSARDTPKISEWAGHSTWRHKIGYVYRLRIRHRCRIFCVRWRDLICVSSAWVKQSGWSLGKVGNSV